MEEILRTIYYDINSTEVTLANSVFKLVLSMVLGVLVGVERKRKGQIAGVRTFALISMGACMAMLLSIYVPQVYLGLKRGSGPHRGPGYHRRGFSRRRRDDSYEGVGQGTDHGGGNMDDGHYRHGCRSGDVLVLDTCNGTDSRDPGAAGSVGAPPQYRP